MWNTDRLRITAALILSVTVHFLVMGMGPSLHQQGGKSFARKSRRVTMTFAPRRVAAPVPESPRESAPPVQQVVAPPRRMPAPSPEIVEVLVREIPAPVPVKKEASPLAPADMPAEIAAAEPAAVAAIPSGAQKAAGLLPLREARPLYKNNPPPVYPPDARRRGWQGTVMLEAFVGVTGRVGDVRLARSSGHKILDRAAMRAVRAWLFEPGRQGEKQHEMWVRVPVRFALQ